MALLIFILFDIWKNIIWNWPGEDSLGWLARGIHQGEFDREISLVLSTILTYSSLNIDISM